MINKQHSRDKTQPRWKRKTEQNKKDGLRLLILHVHDCFLVQYAWTREKTVVNIY